MRTGDNTKHIRKKEITAPIFAVSRLAPRRSAPMHNIGAVTAVMADALLKDTVFSHFSKKYKKMGG